MKEGNKEGGREERKEGGDRVRHGGDREVRWGGRKEGYRKKGTKCREGGREDIIFILFLNIDNHDI